jgi:hypothetical protein
MSSPVFSVFLSTACLLLFTVFLETFPTNMANIALIEIQSQFGMP